MIDALDTQTHSLPLDEPKRRRGRPATGKAMTPAERQKAYRERLKSQRNVTEKHEVPYEEVVAIAQELGERCRKAEKRVEDLEKQLLSRNSNRVKGISYRALTEKTLDQLAFNEKRADAEAAKNWSFGAYLLWDNLAELSNVQEAAREADRKKMRKIVGLGPKDPK